MVGHNHDFDKVLADAVDESKREPREDQTPRTVRIPRPPLRLLNDSTTTRSSSWVNAKGSNRASSCVPSLRLNGLRDCGGMKADLTFRQDVG